MTKVCTLSKGSVLDRERSYSKSNKKSNCKINSVALAGKNTNNTKYT